MTDKLLTWEEYVSLCTDEYHMIAWHIIGYALMLDITC